MSHEHMTGYYGDRMVINLRNADYYNANLVNHYNKLGGAGCNLYSNLRGTGCNDTITVCNNDAVTVVNNLLMLIQQRAN